MTTVILAGGTAGMAVGADGAVHAGDGALLSRIRRDRTLGSLSIVDWGSKPSMHLSPAELLELVAIVRRHLATDSSGGVVVVQGTDAMEETSFVLDLLVRDSSPVVVTGAMETLDSRHYDGIHNLRAAIQVIESRKLMGAGALVVMDSEVHLARDATKVRSAGKPAFASPHLGRLAHIDGRRLDLEQPLPAKRHFQSRGFRLPVPIVTAAMGQGGSDISAWLAAGVAGLVIAAGGSGQTHPELLRECVRAIDSGVPVVLTSRAIGGVPTRAYGYEGSTRDWAHNGAILGGILSPLKARVALSLALGSGKERGEIEELFGTFH